MYIRNLFSLLFATSLLFSCANDDGGNNGGNPNDPTNNSDNTNQESNLLLTLVRGQNIFFSDISVGETTVRALITNDENEVISDEIIPMGSSVELRANYDPSRYYMLHIVMRGELNGVENGYSYNEARFYRIYSFPDIEIDTYRIDFQPSQNVETTGDRNTFFYLDGLNYGLQSISLNTPGGGQYGASPPPNTPDFNYISSYQDPSKGPVSYLLRGLQNTSSISRYIFVENVEAGTKNHFNFNELPESSVHMVPSNGLSMLLLGAFADNIKDFYRLYTLTNQDTQQVTFHLPENVFDTYVLNASKFVPDNYFHASRTYYDPLELPTQIELPNLSATSKNRNISQYSMSTEGEYDFYKILFSYSDSDYPDPITKNLEWSVVGNPSSQVSFSMPNLLDIVLESQDNFNLSLNQLEGGLPYLFNSSELSGLKNYVELHLDATKSPSFLEIPFNHFTKY